MWYFCWQAFARMSPPVSGRVDRLDQIMKALDSVCSNLKDEELQRLAAHSKQTVTKFRNVLKRTQVEQVAKLVEAKDWPRASVALKQHTSPEPPWGRSRKSSCWSATTRTH
jgi:hypothetical protein